MNQNFIDKVIRDTERLAGGDCYMKFVVLWTVFEAWMKENNPGGRAVRTRDALDWFKQKNNPLKDSKDDFWKTSSSRKQIFNVCSRLDGISVQDENDPAETIEAIYQARNRVVHGEWQIGTGHGDSDERNMIHASAELLHDWIVSARRNGVF